MENWREIKGFETLYEVSDLGRVKSLGNGMSTDSRTKEVRIMKTRIKKTGYEHIKLCKEGGHKHTSVHRLVALAFLDKPVECTEVNHIDGVKANNQLSNLEWVTGSRNQKHAFELGLQVPIRGKNNKQSIPIIQMDLKGVHLREWDSIGDAVRALGKNKHGIISCCKNRHKSNTAYGFKWKYKDGRTTTTESS